MPWNGYLGIGRGNFVLASLESFSTEALIETVRCPTLPGIVKPVGSVSVIPLVVRRTPVAPMAIVMAPMVLYLWSGVRHAGGCPNNECCAQESNANYDAA
jgi:hypothetical protein